MAFVSHLNYFIKIKFDNNNLKGLSASRVECHEEEELVLIGFNDTIKPGEAQLVLNYSGCISDIMTGLYKAKYIHPNGEERYTFTTQFEVFIYIVLSDLLIIN
jgi:hypothetical protein